ncbi:hypothetical protein J6590_016923 [Homalodisca vitripennis]|nr:hypothetical protein J6590_016923 [Homalodisca vitripennis]
MHSESRLLRIRLEILVRPDDSIRLQLETGCKIYITVILASVCCTAVNHHVSLSLHDTSAAKYTLNIYKSVITMVQKEELRSHDSPRSWKRPNDPCFLSLNANSESHVSVGAFMWQWIAVAALYGAVILKALPARLQEAAASGCGLASAKSHKFTSTK